MSSSVAVVKLDGYGQRYANLAIVEQMPIVLSLMPRGNLAISAGNLFWQGDLEDMLDALALLATTAKDEIVCCSSLYLRRAREGADQDKAVIWLASVGQVNYSRSLAKVDFNQFIEAIGQFAAADLDDEVIGLS